MQLGKVKGKIKFYYLSSKFNLKGFVVYMFIRL